MTDSVFVFKPHSTYDQFVARLESPAGHAVLAEVESHFSSLVAILDATQTVGHDSVIQLDPTDTLTLRNVTKPQLTQFADRFEARHHGVLF